MNHDKMTNISAKRGFLWPSFEIYSGVSGFTDYGPLGASLKNNIMQKWRKQYVSGEGFYEIEGPTVMPKEVLKASGHVDNFTDPMTKCEECGEVFRADHIIEEVIGEDVESLENEELDQIVIVAFGGQIVQNDVLVETIAELQAVRPGIGEQLAAVGVDVFVAMRIVEHQKCAAAG